MSETLQHTTIADELRQGRSVTYVTVGVSMRPLLVERQTHVTIVPLSEARKGDILLYIRSNGALVLHRCIKQDPAFYYMRGDNTHGLERIRREQAIGVVTHIYRRGRQFPVSHAGYRIYAWLWTVGYPLRYLWHGCKGILRRLCGKEKRT